MGFKKLIPIILLSGCANQPLPPEPDLRITQLKAPPTTESIEPANVPSLPKGITTTIDISGSQVKVKAFNAEQLKVLLEIQDAAKANRDLVKGMNQLIKSVEAYSDYIKSLAELEEARAARLEQDLYQANQQIQQERLNNQIDTVTWKIISILALAVGL
jgi:hypothetical protein